VFSPDASLVASVHQTWKIYIWDAAIRLQKELHGQNANDAFICVAFSLDGKQIAAGSGYLRIWLRTESNGWVEEHTGLPRVTRKVSPSIQIWETTTGAWQKTLDCQYESPIVLAFSPNGEKLAAGLAEGNIQVWDTTNYRSPRTLYGHSGAVTAILFSSDGQIMASASVDLTVRTWIVGSLWHSIPFVGNTIDGILSSHTSKLTIEPSWLHWDWRFLSNSTVFQMTGVNSRPGAFHDSQSRLTLANPGQLFKRDNWIYYKSLRILRLPPGYLATSTSVLRNRMVASFTNGQLLTFEFDLSLLPPSDENINQFHRCRLYG
jgi:hypothetical protein